MKKKHVDISWPACLTLTRVPSNTQRYIMVAEKNSFQFWIVTRCGLRRHTISETFTITDSDDGLPPVSTTLLIESTNTNLFI